ncbi:vacuolar protein sorting-associated protein 33B isoform 2-T2 [Amazona ochrocephala]
MSRLLRCHGTAHFRRGGSAGVGAALGRSGSRHGLRRPPRRARGARLRHPEAAGAGPAHLPPGAAPREEGPVHRGRPDEPPGPHRQRLHTQGSASSSGRGSGRCGTSLILSMPTRCRGGAGSTKSSSAPKSFMLVRWCWRKKESLVMSPATSGPSTCSPWTRTSSAWNCLSSSVTTSCLPRALVVLQEGDHRWINSIARALQLLNSLYGPFGRAYGIGRCAKMSFELWRDLEGESEGDGQGRKPEIGNVFLMDRDTDYVTALCSQVVYEGLVDDTFRIKCGSVDFGPDVTSSDKSIKVLLNAQDKVFSQIRNEHFSSVFGFLSQKSRNLQAQYDRRRGMDIKQMKNFVSQELKGLKQEHRLLSLHIGACESIMKKKTKQDFQEMIKAEHSLLEGFDIRESTSFIEEHIDRQVSPIESLRLMCLLSITENGLVPKDYRSLKTQYLQSYGPEHLLTFHNLKRIGLLTEQAAGETLTAVESRVSKLVTDRAAGKITDAFNSLARKSNFRAISKKLGLVCDCGAAALPACPPVPEELWSVCDWGCGLSTQGDMQRMGPELQPPQAGGFSPGQGLTAVSWSVLAGSHWCSGGLGTANTPALLQQQCWPHAAAWHRGGSSAAPVLGWR